MNEEFVVLLGKDVKLTPELTPEIVESINNAFYAETAAGQSFIAPNGDTLFYYKEAPYFEYRLAFVITANGDFYQFGLVKPYVITPADSIESTHKNACVFKGDVPSPEKPHDDEAHNTDPDHEVIIDDPDAVNPEPKPEPPVDKTPEPEEPIVDPEEPTEPTEPDVPAEPVEPEVPEEPVEPTNPEEELTFVNNGDGTFTDNNGVVYEGISMSDENTWILYNPQAGMEIMVPLSRIRPLEPEVPSEPEPTTPEEPVEPSEPVDEEPTTPSEEYEEVEWNGGDIFEDKNGNVWMVINRNDSGLVLGKNDAGEEKWFKLKEQAPVDQPDQPEPPVDEVPPVDEPEKPGDSDVVDVPPVEKKVFVIGGIEIIAENEEEEAVLSEYQALTDGKRFVKINDVLVAEILKLSMTDLGQLIRIDGIFIYDEKIERYHLYEATGENFDFSEIKETTRQAIESIVARMTS